LFPFVLGTEGIVKIYSGCFPLSLVLKELSKYTLVVSLCPWYWRNCQNILQLFPFVLGTEVIVKIYSGCFPLSLVLRGLSKYTLVVSLCSRYWGNCQNILRLFPFVLGTEVIVKIYSGCFSLSLVLRKLSRRVWRYQRGNQNPYIGEEQTTQWQKSTNGQTMIYKRYV
jgi:hypothetical protein